MHIVMRIPKKKKKTICPKNYKIAIFFDIVKCSIFALLSALLAYYLLYMKI